MKRRFISVILSITATVSTYGFAFLIGTRAIAFLVTKNLVWGFCLRFLSLIYIAFTFISLRYTAKKMTAYSVTSFRGSDLTKANFDNAKLGISDFTGAVGRANVF